MTGPGATSRGRICTFYSYKGGVGRSMALANVGVLMAQWGHRVLLVDWDLEAPGLGRYFDDLLPPLRLLIGRTHIGEHEGIVEIAMALSRGEPAGWRDKVVTVPVPRDRSLDFIAAGLMDGGYAERLQHLDWEGLFANHDFGARLEAIRNEWLQAYDFVLIDSRTGITDIGGICTIYLPDILVALFTANHQSVEGVADVVTRARRARSGLPVDRTALTCVPVPARDESRIEYEQSQVWRREYERLLAPLYTDFLPREVSPADALDILRIPSVPYWSFGERLPVLTESPSDPSTITYYYTVLARLLTTELSWFDSAPPISGPTREASPGIGSDYYLTPPGTGITGSPRSGANQFLITPRALDQQAPASAYLEQVRDLAPAELTGREDELAELAAFCRGKEPYAWWTGGPWSGKTALMAWFVLHPPAGVDVVSFFVNARMAGQADSIAFSEALIDQLGWPADEGPSTPYSSPAKETLLRSLLVAAAGRAELAGRTLVLVVDGLDEDQSARQRLPSIASLLPVRPPAGLRIIVAGRPNPPLPADVPAIHPLRSCPVRVLRPSSHAHAAQLAARQELLDLLRAGQAEQDVVGYLAASGGWLTSDDLEELTDLPPYQVELILTGASGRSFSRHVPTGQKVPVYSLAHEMLATEAESAIGDRQLQRYSNNLVRMGLPAVTAR